MKPKIIIHGGFFSEAGNEEIVRQKKREALNDIIVSSYNFLQTHSALDAAVHAVTLLEDCELFNAGKGSQIQRDGKIRLSASVMDGATEKFAGVINIEDVEHPIAIARMLLGHDDAVLSGEGALRFARANGVGYFNPETAARRKENEEKLKSHGRGTVGCVALDTGGALAAATSTGGKGFELPGRVSDSATVAGNYANRFTGVSATGVGEHIVNSALAAKIVTRVTDGASLEEACKKTFEELRRANGFAGVIAIDHEGNIFHGESHPTMVYALHDDEVEVF